MSPARPDNDSGEASPQAIELRSLLARYERALNTADEELAVSCYTDDGVLMPQGLPTSGRNELAGAYRGFFALRRYDVRFQVDELVVAGDTLAYAITRSTASLTTVADGTRSAGANREMFLFRRADGAWRIARYIFNHDVRSA